MKIIQTCLPRELRQNIGLFQKDQFSFWNRTFLIDKFNENKYEIVSLNLFERLIWTFEELFCSRKYKFGQFTRVIPSSEIESTVKKADEQAKTILKVNQPEVKPPVIEQDAQAQSCQLQGQVSRAICSDEVKPQSVTKEESLPFEGRKPVVKTELTEAQKRLRQQQMVKNYIRSGNLDKALVENHKVQPLEERTANYTALADAYTQSGRLQEASKIKVYLLD